MKSPSKSSREKGEGGKEKKKNPPGAGEQGLQAGIEEAYRHGWWIGKNEMEGGGGEVRNVPTAVSKRPTGAGGFFGRITDEGPEDAEGGNR
jgi:hypothetical protein